MEKLFHKSQKRLDVSSSSVQEGERVVIKGEDRISLLPDPLLCHILSFLTTEQAVRTSVLSSRWRHLWKWVPSLELDSSDFTNDQVCVDFIHNFLAFQGKHYLREFKLTIDHDVLNSDASLYEACLGRVDIRKLERFQVENRFEERTVDDIVTPLTLSVCEALVCLKLHFVRLNEFESLSMPCLKIMYLEDVVLPSDAAAEELISCSPVLEVLKICLSRDDFVIALRVCSLSLKSFTLKRVEPVDADADAVVRSVVIDAPKLEYLSLMDYYHFRSFKITNVAESFKVDIDVEFAPMSDFVLEMMVIYNFSGAKDTTISCVKDMTISWKTLQFIYDYNIMNPLPKFYELTRLRGTVCLNSSSHRLPMFLESFPNLKHLTLELFFNYPVALITRHSFRVRRCLVSSLEYVEIESPVTEIAAELDLARYFIRNATALKKLVLLLKQSSTGEKHKPGVLEQLIESPRRSSLCQFEVIPVVPTPKNPRSEEDVYVKSNRF